MTARSDLSAPLVPADIDIAGLPGFMLNVERLFASELWALASGDEFKAAVALWGRAWQQTPAGSLPNDDRLLAAFSGAGKGWRKVKVMAMHGFVLCSDNRFYHRVLCEDVLKAAKHRELRKERTAAATKARQVREGDDPKPPHGGRKLNGISETDQRNVGRNDERNEDRNEHRNEVRHEQRNDTVATTLREPLRGPIDKTRQDIRDSLGGGGDPEPLAPPPAPPPWNSRENFDRVERRCREVLPRDWVQDLVVGPIARLEAEQGVDLEREIVPTLIDLAASRRVPIRTWAVLASAVAERVAVQRQARVVEGLSPTPAKGEDVEWVDLQGLNPVPANLLIRLLKSWKAGGAWPTLMLGDRLPGQPGCRVPARFLVGEAA